MNYKKTLILILFFVISTHIFRLDYPNAYIFDEVYHAFTAKEYLKGSKDAWSPWATPPKGVAYEWTHPPLAKEIMAISMFLANSTDAWAWRLPGTLLGLINILLVYLIGKKLFNNEIPAFLAAFIFSIDGLNFVQSRTGMNDIYLVTFILFSLFFLLRSNFLFSAIFWGMALSSKWAAIYLLPVYVLFIIWKRYPWQIAYFITIPPIIYIIFYLPYFILGYNFDQFIELQKQMWIYHTSLKATHDYSSPWWSWPFNLYPVWYFVEYQGDKISNIFASGNPAVFLLGFAAILLTAWEAIRTRSKELFFVVLCYLAFLLPWAISPRIMFLYHYSPSIPFLSLALGYQLGFLANRRNLPLLVLLLVLITISFLLIYPFLTGIPLPKNIVQLFFYTNNTKNPF